MNNTEIKKALYKQKPEAQLRYIRGGNAYYYASLTGQIVNFEIPVTDMGEAAFLPRMEAALLIRWLQS